MTQNNITAITTYEIDELANLVPLASDVELKALQLDINKNGQTEPIILWNNKIVDGRNRQIACQKLGIELKVIHLHSNLTYDEVARTVKSMNTRRNLTETQKIMSAVKSQKNFGGTNKEVSEQWGISERTFKNAKYIDTNEPSFIDKLFDGNSVKIYDPTKGFEITTNKVNAIARLIKTNKEKDMIEIDETEVVDLTFNADALIKTEAGKQWFYDKKENLNIVKQQMILDYIELANLKYKLKTD